MRYYVIAGEASGDLHGSMLIKALKDRDVDAKIRFWGGDAMADVSGKAPVKHISELAIMGFVEVVTHLRQVIGNMFFCKKDILSFSPDVVIGVDYPGFNLKIERWAHRRGIKTVHFISPNLWAWKQGRIKQMKDNLDALCYILPFEQDFFKVRGMQQSYYVGHPLVDSVGNYQGTHLDTGGKPIIALLPGSRRQELHRSLPLMVELASRHKEYRFIVAGMSLIDRSVYDKYISTSDNVELLIDRTYDILLSAYAAVVCSGTATLETALFNVPQVVCYAANPVSICIAKALVNRRIKYISLVNLIADQPVVTELLQQEFNTARLEQEFAAIVVNMESRNRMQQQYAYVRSLLGDGGAANRVAEIVISLVR
ncbi:MAG: lipid-A-disaccharide synthase [Bacteroidales bacterium]|nr:lipid-A-disaccharide synthase [Bacteroidales bacterium]